MRIALLADIHGNLPAFEAVLAELERLQPDYVVVDGDLINGTPMSSAVVEQIRQRDWIVVRGNHEFYLLDMGTERAVPGSNDPTRWGALHWLSEQISAEQYAYLAMLPDERTFYLHGTQPICITHGIPGQNRIGFYPMQEDDEIIPHLENVWQPTFVSAHTHQQINRHVQGAVRDNQTGELIQREWHLINPGSVGLPLNGNTNAQFAIIENVPVTGQVDAWSLTHFGIPYDQRPLLEAFTTSGLFEAGGVMSLLFYWEVCTAEPDIIFFFRWATRNGYDASGDIDNAFVAYNRATGRDAYIASIDPLKNGSKSGGLCV